MFRSTLTAAGAAFVLGACTNAMPAFQHSGNPLTQPYNYDAAQAAKPTGDPFTQALTAEYRALATKEGATWYDWFDSDFFARKALAAAAGTDTGPEDPGLWRITSAERADLDPARARLMAALEAGRTGAPAEAATAQAAYDCWVEEQEEAWQMDEIAKCKDTFETAMAALEAALAEPEPEPEPEPQPAPEPVVELPRLYTVFFDFDSFSLTAVGRAVLDQLVEDWGGEAVPMDLIGHADRSGSDAYNQRLSERRANAVSDYLIAQGFDVGHLTASGRGESDPEVATEDGVREARNRRVVIAVESQ